MSGPRFFQTKMVQVFFEGTMPRLYRAIDRLAGVIGGKAEYRVINVGADEEELQGRLNALGEEGFVFREMLDADAGELVILMERRGGGS